MHLVKTKPPPPLFVQPQVWGGHVGLGGVGSDEDGSGSGSGSGSSVGGGSDGSAPPPKALASKASYCNWDF